MSNFRTHTEHTMLSNGMLEQVISMVKHSGFPVARLQAGNQPYDCNTAYIKLVSLQVVSTSTLQVYHVYGEDLTDVPDWDFGMVVVNRSQRKEMGRFMVLSQSPAGKKKLAHHMTSYPTWGNHLV